MKFLWNWGGHRFTIYHPPKMISKDEQKSNCCRRTMSIADKHSTHLFVGQKLLAQTEVSENNVTLRVEQNILQLYVSVNDPQLEVEKTIENGKTTG